MAIHRAFIVVACLAIAGCGALLLWPSKKFVSLSTPSALSAKAERAPQNALKTSFDGLSSPHQPLSLDQAVKHWPRFADLLRVAQHPGYFIERRTNDFWIVSIGEKLPNRFHSWEMLRVWKSGLIEKVNVPTGTWVVEYKPD